MKFSDYVDCVIPGRGKLLILGDFNVHVDDPKRGSCSVLLQAHWIHMGCSNMTVLVPTYEKGIY